MVMSPHTIQVELAISIRRLWALEAATCSFCVALTCTTLHEALAQDRITSESHGLRLVDGNSGWVSGRFMPALYALGAHEQTWSEWQMMVTDERGPNGRPMLLGTRDLTAKMQLDFDMRAYPLDLQILSICLALKSDSSVARLVPLRPDRLDGAPDLVDVNYAQTHLPTFSFITDCPHVAGCRVVHERLRPDGPQRGQSQAFVHIPVMRSYDHGYIAGIAALPFGIGLVGCLISFALQGPRPEGARRLTIEVTAHRLTIDVMLLFIAMVHRSYVRSAQPVADCSTRIDIFAMALVALLLTVTTSHALFPVVEHFLPGTIAHSFDLAVACAFVAFWLVYTLAFGVSCSRSQERQRRWLQRLLRFYQHEHGFETDASGPGHMATSPGPSRADADAFWDGVPIASDLEWQRSGKLLSGKLLNMRNAGGSPMHVRLYELLNDADEDARLDESTRQRLHRAQVTA